MAQNLSNLSNWPSWSCDREDETSPQNEKTATNPELSEITVVVLSVVCTLASVCGSFGNSLVLLAVSRNRNLRTIPDLFISSLAVSDFAVCFLYLPLLIYGFNHYAEEAIMQNVYYSTARAFLGHCSLIASVTNILTVTVDRVIAIRLPLKYLEIMTVKNALYMITVVWLISLTYGVLYARSFISPFYLLYYCVILLLGTLSMYVYIFITAKRQENKIQLHNPGIDRSAARYKTEKKAAKTIFVVVGIYVLCWLPFLLLPAFLNPSRKACQFKKAFPWVQAILACNSSLNPYVYCMRSQKYRLEFAEMLRLKRFIDRPLNSTSMHH